MEGVSVVPFKNTALCAVIHYHDGFVHEKHCYPHLLPSLGKMFHSLSVVGRGGKNGDKYERMVTKVLTFYSNNLKHLKS